LHPTDTNLLLGGTQDNGTARYNGSLIDQSNPQVMYHTFINRNNKAGGFAVLGPELSLDGGNTWTRRGCFGCTAQSGNLSPADRLSDYAPLAQHSGFSGLSGNVVYFGTHRLYRSANQGQTWTGLGASLDGFGADLTKNLPSDVASGFPSYLSAIAVHPRLDGSVNPPGELVWVGTGDGLVHFTANAGALTEAAFTNVTKAPLPNRYVIDIALDANEPRRAVVTYSGFDVDTPEAPGHIFATDDQGATWHNLSGNLPDVPVNSVVLDPLRPGALYAGTDIGVLQTLDGGATWLPPGAGLPTFAVLMLRYHAPSRSLVAATHGRGIYRVTLPQAVASVSAASFAGPTLVSEAIVAAFGVGLANTTQAAGSLPLPVELAGTRLLVRDSAGIERAAPLFFVAPTQVNYQMPPGLAPGLASVTVMNTGNAVAFGAVQLAAVAPGLFAANANGQGVAAAVALRIKSDGAQSFEPIAQFDSAQQRYVARPLELGPAGERFFVLLFGTGVRHLSALTEVRVTLGGVAAAVSYAGAQGDLAGLDQVNLEVPRSLAGRGEIELVLRAAGRTANAVTVSVRLKEDKTKAIY
jgi:uncharacterized protein (TIGR03437 family)